MNVRRKKEMNAKEEFEIFAIDLLTNKEYCENSVKRLLFGFTGIEFEFRIKRKDSS